MAWDSVGPISTGGAAPAGQTREQLIDYIQTHYPTYAGFLAIPDVANVLIWAAASNWDQLTMEAHLQQTPWYKQTQSTARDWLALGMTDPATAGAKRTQRIYQLNAQAQAMGASGMTLPQLSDLAEQSLLYGWDDQTTKVQLAAWAQAHPVAGSDPNVGLNVNAGGDVGANMNQVRGIAHQYLVNVDNRTAADMAWKMFRGEMDVQGVTSWAANQARFNHPDMAKDIDNGYTPTQIMSGVTQNVATLLELPQEQIDLLNPRYSELLQHKDANGTVRRMTESESGVWARQQTEWRDTTNGKQTEQTYAQAIAKGMGALK